jgi:ferredoxin
LTSIKAQHQDLPDAVPMSSTTAMRRNIIRIDEEKCDGCGDCIPGCPEGALQIVNGKARLVGDVLCDGLGACIGRCPKGAITIEEREAPAYDERQVMANVVKQGPAVLQAHLNHLQEHKEKENLQVAMTFLHDKGLQTPLKSLPHGSHGGGCPGSRSTSFQPRPASPPVDGQSQPSQLTHWPIQLHLLNPTAPHYQGADVLLAADCAPFAVADFHKDFLRGKSLAIACPKLDENQEVYVQKLTAMVDAARINTLTVIIMQVPCCQGLLRLAQAAVAQAQRKVPVRCVVASLQGEILQDAWV